MPSGSGHGGRHGGRRHSTTTITEEMYRISSRGNNAGEPSGMSSYYGDAAAEAAYARNQAAGHAPSGYSSSGTTAVAGSYVGYGPTGGQGNMYRGGYTGSRGVPRAPPPSLASSRHISHHNDEAASVTSRNRARTEGFGRLGGYHGGRLLCPTDHRNEHTTLSSALRSGKTGDGIALKPSFDLIAYLAYLALFTSYDLGPCCLYVIQQQVS
ncbi:hypothetical protein O1611_g6058 [Lasiodiplodia mahajangana]|uniref:Uncharacterized protein n=1 Tax=Lasiodiplodia mahajangana TaxID=1108764 RepID=A0ACC2JJB1_9PEZI|nr:hypothetical protein O1611_g6058 [Lasiodiplodia mahajangana]